MPGAADFADFNYFLNRKYAQLQQQADATTSNAASQAIQANASATASTAAANLDNVRANLAPAESAASIGVQRAQANLFGQQAKVVVPEATARIGQIGAETGFTNTQAAALRHTTLTGIFGGDAGVPNMDSMAAQGSLVRPLGSTTAPGTTPTEQQPNESYTAWVSRLRGMGYSAGAS